MNGNNGNNSNNQININLPSMNIDNNNNNNNNYDFKGFKCRDCNLVFLLQSDLVRHKHIKHDNNNNNVTNNNGNNGNNGNNKDSKLIKPELMKADDGCVKTRENQMMLKQKECYNNGKTATII